MSRARGRRAALQAIPEDAPAAEEDRSQAEGPVAEIMQLIDGLEAAGRWPQAALADIY